MAKVKFTTSLDKELLQSLKIKAIREETDVSKILERLIGCYLNNESCLERKQQSVQQKKS